MGLFDDDSDALDAQPAPEVVPRRRVKAMRTATELPAPKTFEEALTALNDEERSFVEHYITGGVATDAVRTTHPQLGNSEVVKVAARLMARHQVKSAIALGRLETAVQVREATKFNLQAAFDELGEAADFARATSNATALARIIELRARLLGLLVDKQEIKSQQMSVVIHEQAPSPVPVDVSAIDGTAERVKDK
jgi:hypothetical protein